MTLVRELGLLDDLYMGAVEAHARFLHVSLSEKEEEHIVELVTISETLGCLK